MKKLTTICGAVLAALFLCHNVEANQSFIAHDSYLVYATSLTVAGVQVGNGATSVVTGSSGTIPYFRTDVDAFVSAQVVVSSDSFASKTFTDGTQSTGSFTITSFAALSSATATSTLTLSSSSALANDCISGGGPGLGQFEICNPKNFPVTGSNSVDCPVIAAAINSFSVILATCPSAGSGNIIYTTAPYSGASWNQFQLSVSSYTAIQPGNLISSNPVTSIGIGRLKGGQDNATVSIGGIILTANTSPFYPVTSNAVTAINLSSAIMNTPALAAIVKSTTIAGQSVVYTTSTAVGTTANYALFTSSNGALGLSAPVTLDASGNTATGVLIGGTNFGYSLSTSKISIANHGFNTGLPLLYSGTPAIGGLTTATTYFAIYLDPNTIYLATGAVAAQTNTFVTLTSSSSQSTADTYTLAPLAITGTPSYQWIISDDATTWFPFTTTLNNLTIPSVSIAAYNSTGTVTFFDFGHMDYGYLGLSIVYPTTGAINMKAKVIGKTQ